MIKTKLLHWPSLNWGPNPCTMLQTPHDELFSWRHQPYQYIQGLFCPSHHQWQLKQHPSSQPSAFFVGLHREDKQLSGQKFQQQPHMQALSPHPIHCPQLVQTVSFWATSLLKIHKQQSSDPHMVSVNVILQVIRLSKHTDNSLTAYMRIEKEILAWYFIEE